MPISLPSHARIRTIQLGGAEQPGANHDPYGDQQQPEEESRHAMSVEECVRLDVDGVGVRRVAEPAAAAADIPALDRPADYQQRRRQPDADHYSLRVVQGIKS